MGIPMAGTSIPMNVQPSMVQPYTLSVQPSFPTIVTSGSQQTQQPGPIPAVGTAANAVQPGNNGQQMVQQGQVGGQPNGGGSAGSSGSGCGVGPQPQAAN